MSRSPRDRFGSLSRATPLALPGQRIGLLGGSFNPPHAAHRQITDIAMRRLGLDAVWWLVTPGNPLKSHDGLPSLDERMAWCRSLADDPRIKVTGLERYLASSYTAATLRYLLSRHPGVRFVWLMGADNLASFHRWRDWRIIAATIPIAVIDRPGQRYRAINGPAGSSLARWRQPEAQARMLPSRPTPGWVYLGGRLSDLSSTRLRQTSARADGGGGLTPSE